MQWWVNIACLVGFKLLWLNRSLVFSSKSPIYYHIAVSVFTICAQGMGAIIGNVESWKQMLKCQDDKSTFSRLTPICESQNVPFFDKIRRFMYHYILYISLLLQCFFAHNKVQILGPTRSIISWDKFMKIKWSCHVIDHSQLFNNQ